MQAKENKVTAFNPDVSAIASVFASLRPLLMQNGVGLAP